MADNVTRELCQTREFTRRETDILARSWREIVLPKGGGASYRAVATAWYAFAGFLVISIMMAVNHLNGPAPNLALQLAFAAIGFAVAMILSHLQNDAFERKELWKAPRTGHRYFIQPDGIAAHGIETSHVFGWNAVETMANRADHLVVLFRNRQPLFIVKDAFAGQDAPGFCAELERRWQAAKGPDA